MQWKCGLKSGSKLAQVHWPITTGSPNKASCIVVVVVKVEVEVVFLLLCM